MKFALIQDGKVHELFDEEPQLHPGLTVRAAAAEVQVGWVVEGDNLSPPAAEPAAAVRSRLWSLIKIERDQRTDTGGYLVAGKWFHSDQKSRSQQLGLVLLGAGIPAGLQWKTMDGSFTIMTPALAQQILAAAAASDIAIFAAAEIHKAAMEASAAPAAYDFSGGWPAGFGG